MNQNRKPICVFLWTAALLAASPGSLRACAACYGDPDSTMSMGLTWAISVLVAVVICVLAGLAAFFIRAARHAGPELPSLAQSDSGTKQF